jgi:hypothetical protein
MKRLPSKSCYNLANHIDMAYDQGNRPQHGQFGCDLIVPLT